VAEAATVVGHFGASFQWVVLASGAETIGHDKPAFHAGASVKNMDLFYRQQQSVPVA
jgi:hypothetical protein